MSDDLMENWGETKGALLDGLDGGKRDTVSQLLENQKSYLMESASSGSTEANNIANLRKTLIPMIRRVIPGTIATELVGVQAMSGPAAQVFTLRHQYEEAAGPGVFPPGAAGFGEERETAQGEEVFGNESPLRRFYSQADGDFPAGASGLGSFGQAGTDDAAQALSASGQGSSSEISSADADTGLGLGGYDTAPEHADSLLGPWAGNYRGGSGSFLEGTGGRKMSLRILSQVVEAQTRKLQAGWTLEAMQDMNSQHGLDLEDEMTRALSADIVQEIDQEIIADLIALSGTVASFDGASDSSFSGAAVGGNYAPAFVGDRLANIGPIINQVANEIARKTRKGAGNFIVVSPMIVSVLQSASKSVFAPAIQGSFKGPNNTMLVGTLNGTIKVYSYLWNQTQAAGTVNGAPNTLVGDGNDTILVGYKGGNKETDAGYFYCPYIPLMSSGTVYNAVTHQPVMSVMTRYAKAVFTATETSLGNSSDYYGKINVSALDFN